MTAAYIDTQWNTLELTSWGTHRLIHNGDNHIMWLLHSYSLMPSWSTENVIEMASMHAGYEADQCIATGASIKEVIILEPHVLYHCLLMHYYMLVTSREK